MHRGDNKNTVTQRGKRRCQAKEQSKLGPRKAAKNAKSETGAAQKGGGRRGGNVRGVSWLLWNAVRRQVIVFDFIFLAFLRFPSRHSTLRAECGWSSGTPVHTYVRFEGLISIWGDAGLTPKLVSSANRGIWYLGRDRNPAGFAPLGLAFLRDPSRLTLAALLLLLLRL